MPAAGIRDCCALLSEPRRAQEHHLRAWYVLGDLQDRAGDPTSAAAYFRRILRRDATFADVPERLAGLGQ